MQLWNDYEGKTLAGTFPIEMLLRTEGRNASFATHDRNGRPAVLRLTEALNDEQELRARYGAIQQVGQPNLVTIEDYGADEIDGTPLVYLVMEPTEENLEEIVQERALSLEETNEVALSLTAAIEALHAHGLVHGMVEPASVMAAGQVIKLRSDCVRPAPGGAEGERARAEDVFGLADVLNRALTQQHLQDASDALALPEPYATIVRNVVRGSWGLEQVAAELRRFVRPATGPSPQQTHVEPAVPGVKQPALAERQVGGHTAEGAAPLEASAAIAGERPEYRQMHGSREPSPKAEPWQQPAIAVRDRRLVAWLAAAVGVCALALLLWHFARGSNKAGAAAQRASVPAVVHGMAAPAPIPAAKASAAAAAPVHGAVWRVVAYTYNVQSQAEAKARRIADKNADLHPEVYSRTGRAPYLVTLGGPLTQQQASAMLQRARSQGLARDIYMQNYSH